MIFRDPIVYREAIYITENNLEFMLRCCGTMALVFSSKVFSFGQVPNSGLKFFFSRQLCSFSSYNS